MKGKIALILSVLVVLCACKTAPKKAENIKPTAKTAGVWFSFGEINNMLSNGNFETELQKAVENCKLLKIENVYIHVRSHCNSLYPSKLFPLVKEAENYDYDIFEKMLTAFHQNGVKVHAWVNPYRVQTASSDIEALPKESPAYKWLKDESLENDVNVCLYNGIYLNPAESEAQRLILDGIKEIITNYDVDGIHFDDYFYPTQSEDFDSKSYEAYKQNAENPLLLYDWRRFNVNSLISGCYFAIKSKNPEIVFSVSPAASIEKNHTDLYADVSFWIENGYIDTIIPQLYFGFNHTDEDYKFEKLLNEWVTLCKKNREIELLIGLASYKIGTYSETDGAEWQTDTNIIACQAERCFENSAVDGFVIFSYSSLFSEEYLNSEQREALLKTINQNSEEKKNE